MLIQELLPLAPKTTMRIGGVARYFAEPKTREEVEEAFAFAKEKNLPLIVLGGGSNTVFAEGTIEALVLRIKAEGIEESGKGQFRVEAGTYLATLIIQLAEQGHDLSALTGIPGSIGGAIVGNAGQGAGGIWIDRFIEDVTAYIDGEWKTFTKEACSFAYRESIFKHLEKPVVIWSVTLSVPKGEPATIKTEIERLLKKRIETQPHLKTAGSCFKSLPDGTPAWKLIDAAGLRGTKIGGVEIAEKHANFLLNTGGATFADAKAVVEKVLASVPEELEVEMRFVERDGSVGFS